MFQRIFQNFRISPNEEFLEYSRTFPNFPERIRMFKKYAGFFYNIPGNFVVCSTSSPNVPERFKRFPNELACFRMF